jgi:hypothetical protein
MSDQQQISVNTVGHSDMQAMAIRICRPPSSGHLRPYPLLMASCFSVRGSNIFHLECDVRGRQSTLVITVVGD